MLGARARLGHDEGSSRRGGREHAVVAHEVGTVISLPVWVAGWWLARAWLTHARWRDGAAMGDDEGG